MSSLIFCFSSSLRRSSILACVSCSLIDQKLQLFTDLRGGVTDSDFELYRYRIDIVGQVSHEFLNRIELRLSDC